MKPPKPTFKKVSSLSVDFENSQAMGEELLCTYIHSYATYATSLIRKGALLHIKMPTKCSCPIWTLSPLVRPFKRYH